MKVLQYFRILMNTYMAEIEETVSLLLENLTLLIDRFGFLGIHKRRLILVLDLKQQCQIWKKRNQTEVVQNSINLTIWWLLPVLY